MILKDPQSGKLEARPVHVQAAAAERSSWRLFILGVFSWMLGTLAAA
jgi:hypothetical protein